MLGDEPNPLNDGLGDELGAGDDCAGDDGADDCTGDDCAGDDCAGDDCAGDDCAGEDGADGFVECKDEGDGAGDGDDEYEDDSLRSPSE